MMATMKKIGLAVAVAMAVSGQVNATGVPTGDAGTWAALAQQLVVLREQFETLKDSYQTQGNILRNLEGSYGRGAIGLNDSINSASVVPGSWQEVVARQGSGAYGSKQSYYEELIKTLPQELFANPQGQRAQGYQLSSDAVRAAMSGGDALYSEVQVHLNNLATLSRQVDMTTNAKDAADLQNRISAENGMLASAQSKLQALNMNLQANLNNAENQATADNEKFFRWTEQ
ncbi:Type IV secretion system protein virB5 precursor [compost metagenome]|uniref:type IV secretion system protein n=2 Tax=Pseudomonas TaxID=286 RepID=UPI000FB0FC68|nr:MULTISPECIES: type IV secretion system protein [unclassified Pseudomonas]